MTVYMWFVMLLTCRILDELLIGFMLQVSFADGFGFCGTSNPGDGLSAK